MIPRNISSIALLSLALAASTFAQTTAPTTNGMPRVHDPSTIIRDHGLYYVYSTGRGIPFYSSPDLHTWTRGGSVFAALPADVVSAAPGNDGMDAWAPDILKIGDTLYLYYAVSKWDSFASAIGLASNSTLDPASPAYKWVDRGIVISSDGRENMNDIDPGAILAPDGTLWLCYGSYHGTIDLIELDRKTGLRIRPDSTVTIIAGGSEASDLIAHNGYFYLFVNHGSCCQGANSKYHINVGRSKTITGPYLDRSGQPLTTAPGEPFLATEPDRIGLARVGPGHFGRVLDGTKTETPERFSLHYESDATNGGRPSLAIRALSWSADGWPIAGTFN